MSSPIQVISDALAPVWNGPLHTLRDAVDLVPRAVGGGCLCAAACAAVGALLRWRRLVWSGLAIPEAATAGTAFSMGQSTLLPSLGIAAFSDAATETLCTLVATAFAVLWLVPIGRPPRRGGERAAAACFLLATTAAILFVSMSPHGTEEIRALAAGKTLLFLDADDLRTLAWSMPPIALAAFVLARPTAHAAFDRDHARAQGRSVVTAEAVLAAVVFALVSFTVPRAGAPFVFAYLVLPAAAAERCVARPIPTVLDAVVIAVVSFLFASAVAVAWDLPFSTAAAGGALAVAAAIFVLRGVAELLVGSIRGLLRAVGVRPWVRAPAGTMS